MRTFGELDRVGVEGTGTYGVSLARYLRRDQVTVLEVMRSNRQVRRGRPTLSRRSPLPARSCLARPTSPPMGSNGPVAALRTLKVHQRSADKARTQALNQLRALLVTGPDDLRARLRDLTQRELLSTCAGFRIGADDDTLPAITRFGLREHAQRVRYLETGSPRSRRASSGSPSRSRRTWSLLRASARTSPRRCS